MLNTEIEAIDPEAGLVVTQAGKTYRVDIIIGADGWNVSWQSQSESKVTMGVVKLSPSSPLLARLSPTMIRPFQLPQR